MSQVRKAARQDHAAWLEREAVIDRFETAWQQASEPPRIGDFLPPAGSAERIPLLHEMIRIDLEYRGERGERRRVEDYVAEFPELSRTPELLGELHVCADQPRQSRQGQCLGRYELREQLGRGSFSTVYRAWDPHLRRDVAVKLPRPELVADPAGQERSLREAQSAARLRHPAIVPLHEAGREGDITYLVYDFIPGPTLAQRLRQGRPTLRQAAEWVARLADALDCAHRAGLVHRDVKPGNVMMDAAGQPLLADFGLALQTDAAATLTQHGDVLGTPAYMAPEQAAGRSHQVDARSDVYSLGVVLYELLCGRVPFEGSGASVLHRVLHEEPVAPRRLAPSVPADLEAVCLQAIAKEPERRYLSAGDMADDLRRYLRHEPVRARRLGQIGLLVRWCRRRPALALTIAAAVAIVLFVAGLSYWRVTAERDRYRTERDRAQLLLAGLAADQGLGYCEQGEVGYGLLWLARSLQLAPDDADSLRFAVRANLAAWQRRVSRPRLVIPHPPWVSALALSPDGKVLVSAGHDGTARRWDTATGQPLGEPSRHERQVVAAAFSPDGRRFLTGSWDHTARLWDAFTGETIGSPLRHPAVVLAVAFHSDGRTIVTAAGWHCYFWEAATGKSIGAPLACEGPVVGVAFSPDGRYLLTSRAGVPGEQPLSHGVQVWDTVSRTPVGGLVLCQGFTAGSPFSRDGRTFLAAGEDKAARLWETATGKPLGFSLPHQEIVHSMAWSPNGAAVATSSADRTARLWDAVTGRPLGAPLHHPDRVTDTAFTPDGRTLLTGSIDGWIRFWDIPDDQPPHPPLLHEDKVWALALAPDGETVVTGSGELDRRGRAQRWHLGSGQPLGPALLHESGVRAVAISPDGRSLLTGSWGHGSYLWDAATGKQRGPRLPGPESQITAALFTPDGNRILTACFLHKHAQLRDAATGTPLEPPLRHEDSVRAAVVSRDGKVLVTGSCDKTVQLWDAATGQPLGEPLRLEGLVGSVALSSDGRRLLTGSDDGLAQVWDVAARTPLGAPLRHAGTVRAVAFSPDGRYLLTVSVDRTARLWEAHTHKPIGPAFRHDAEIETGDFTPDGRLVLTGGRDRAVRFWEVPFPVEDEPERVQTWIEVLTGMELDAHDSLRTLKPDEWEQRRRRCESEISNLKSQIIRRHSQLLLAFSCHLPR